MFDVLPPSPPPRRSASPRRARPRSTPVAQPQSISVGSRVVKLEWQLPARLRRPIRQELQKQRRQKKQTKAIMGFERRPIYSEVPQAYPHYGQPKAVVPATTEQHTGDVYRRSRPNIAVSLPPYRGSAKQKVPTALRPTAPALRPGLVKNARRPAPTNLARTSNALQKQMQPAAFPIDAGIRDVPYQWQEKEAPKAAPAVSLNEAQALLAPVKEPRRRLTLPLHFSIFPWRKSRLTSKKKD